VRVATLHRFDELVDDMRGRGAVGIAHAEVDDVLAATAGLHLEFGGDVENTAEGDRCVRTGFWGSKTWSS